MEQAGRLLNMAVKAGNNDVVINTFLVGLFGALSLRSVQQQRQIEALEADKDSLLNSNKAIKKSMWDWKQQLFAQAQADGASSSTLSLSKLKAIYGEAQTITQQQGVVAAAVNEDSKTSAPKFVV